jgi:hypothetical protein
MGEVLEQPACDDPGMGKIMACAGVLSPDDQKASPHGLREATATGKQETVTMGKDRPDRPYVAVPGLRRPAGSWITKY